MNAAVTRSNGYALLGAQSMSLCMLVPDYKYQAKIRQDKFEQNFK